MKTYYAFLAAAICASTLAACGGAGGSVSSLNNLAIPNVTSESLNASSSASPSSAHSTAAATYIAIDAGGSKFDNWVADTDYSGGGMVAKSSAINTSLVVNPAPEAIYQTYRYAPSFGYVVGNLLPSGTYTVRLHFAETHFTSTRQRIFNVTINGVQALTNFDIFQAAGAANVAVAKSFTATASSTGVITIRFTASVSYAVVSGLEFTVSSPSPLPSTSPTVPLPADSLADSIGLNTHIPGYFTATDWPTLISRVAALKVRHIRDGILDSDKPYNSAMTSLLLAANAKLDGITDCSGIEYYPTSPTSPLQIQNFNAGIGNRLEYVEAPNEVDNRGVANWVFDTTSCLPALKSAAPGIPFIGPSLANQWSNTTLLGNISNDVTLANAHRYFSGRNPGTAGWGGSDSCGVYGNLQWQMCLAQMNAGKVPVIITETGYNSQTEVDEATQAKYLSRAFLVNLQAGIPHTYVYDLKDYVNGDGFGGDGLIRVNDSIKPAFSAIAAEIGLFSDRGASVVLTPISYSISTKAVNNLLFQKSDGSYILALWNETASWNPTTKVPIIVAPQTVGVTLPNAPVSVSAVSLSDSGNLASAASSVSGATVTLSVDDHATFLSFRLH